MKKLFLAAASLVATACAVPVTDGSPLSQILGKTLSNETGAIVISANGTFSGVINGDPLSGTWREEGGFFCRQGQLGSVVVPDTCQTVTIRGNTLTLVRDRGRGSATRYVIS